MSYEILGVDPATGTYKRTGISTSGLGGFTDEDFDTGPSFSYLILVSDINAGTKIDVFVDGKMKREIDDWQRDSDLDKITFSSNVAENSWIKVRVYS